MSHADLAEEMNRRLHALTGKHGDLDARTIRRYVSGQTGWPQGRHRLALEAVFGSSAEELGFTPRSAKATPSQGTHHPEDPVQRRNFLAVATATSAAAFVPTSSPRVGASDLHRLRAGLDDLTASDDSEGGTQELETAALTHAQRALNLVRDGRATTRVQRQLYAVAADATTAAAWAAIDSHRPQGAQCHLDRALTLAGLSSDPAAKLRVWNNMSMLASQRDRQNDSVAAAHAAREIVARRDPLYASLCHARGALALALMHESRPALKAIGKAQELLAKASASDRPGWIHFYDEAELHGLSAVVHLRLGNPAEAEYHVHNALARIHPDLRRNRSYYTGHLALAQVRQGDLEQACATADNLLTEGLPDSERVRDLMRVFRTEAARTGSARAKEWLASTPTTKGTR